MTQRLRVLRPDSIRIKILVLAVIATLLPSVGMAWLSYLENKQALEAKATEELWSASAQTARELDVWAKERRYDLRVFASSYEVTENLDGIAGARSASAHRRVTDYLKSVSERFGDYDQLLILAPNGRVVASSGERAAAVELPVDWQSRLRSGDFVAGTPYWDDAGQRPEMLVAVPILAAGGRVLGTIAAEVSLLGLSRNSDGLRARRRGVCVAADGRRHGDRDFRGRLGGGNAAPLCPGDDTGAARE